MFLLIGVHQTFIKFITNNNNNSAQWSIVTKKWSSTVNTTYLHQFTTFTNYFW